tara:strand:- start:8787 stop:9359 length:573 start_codon:yes stop_codon:yes gene_type:complete
MEINKNIEKITKQLLEEIGEDTKREGLLKTPFRVAKTWSYLTSGYKKDLNKIVNNAIFVENCDNMILIKDIEFYSLCEHHLLPFFGRAHVSYIPNGKIIGLSKIPRIVGLFSRRLQVQERLTLEIAQTIDSILKPRGVAVVLEANHMCMQMRGVENKNSYASTSSMVGLFREDHKTRKEFLDLINMDKKF